MTETNLNILVRVEGAKEASTEITSVSHATAQVGKQTEETTKRTSNLRRTMSGLATGFLVYKGAQWIKGAVTQTTELAKSTAALSRITGMDAGTASGWVAMAKERGIQTRQLNMGFIGLAKQSQKLSEGNKTTAKEFDRLGISAKQWQSLNTEQRMEAVADSFQRMRNPAERAALAQSLFGRSGQALLPVLAQGRAALHAHIEEQKKATGENNHSLREQMKLVASQREMNRAMLQLKIAVATALMPIMVQFAKILAPLTSAFASLMQKSGVFRVAVIALTAALIGLIVALKIFQLLGKTMSLTTMGWVGVIILVAVALVMLYQKCAWFRAAVQAVMGAVKAAFLWVKDAAMAVWHWIAGHWQLLLAILVGPIGIAIPQIVKHFGTIKKVAETVFNAVKGIVESVAKVVTTVLGGAFKAVETVVLGVVKAVEKMISVAKGIASLPGKALHVLTFGAAQTGGYMGHAGTMLVGEHGPEMIQLPQGARINPFVQSYGGGGGGKETVVQVPVYLDSRQIALALGRFTADAKASR
jgi:hypothetical protein